MSSNSLLARASLFDAVADDYDRIDDVWDAWRFSRIHDFISANLPTVTRTRPQALDAGCGTGFQSFLLAQAGYTVIGIDISDRMIKKAEAKVEQYTVPPLQSPPLFQSNIHPAWLERHHRELAGVLEKHRQKRPVVPPMFAHDNIAHFYTRSYRNDVIVCVGSVLSFVEDGPEIIHKLCRDLAAGGRIFFEIEQRWSLERLWPIADKLLAGLLGYRESWTHILSNLNPGHPAYVDWETERYGKKYRHPFRLYGVGEVEKIFAEYGLKMIDKMGIHQAANLMPSTIAGREFAMPIVRLGFEPLRIADGMLSRRWPFWKLGCTVIYCLEKSAAS